MGGRLLDNNSAINYVLAIVLPLQLLLTNVSRLPLKTPYAMFLAYLVLLV